MNSINVSTTTWTIWWSVYHIVWYVIKYLNITLFPQIFRASHNSPCINFFQTKNWNPIMSRPVYFITHHFNIKTKSNILPRCYSDQTSPWSIKHYNVIQMVRSHFPACDVFDQFFFIPQTTIVVVVYFMLSRFFCWKLLRLIAKNKYTTHNKIQNNCIHL
jgi:hypothetical protein